MKTYSLLGLLVGGSVVVLTNGCDENVKINPANIGGTAGTQGTTGGSSGSSQAGASGSGANTTGGSSTGGVSGTSGTGTGGSSGNGGTAGAGASGAAGTAGQSGTGGTGAAGSAGAGASGATAGSGGGGTAGTMGCDTPCYVSPNQADPPICCPTGTKCCAAQDNGLPPPDQCLSESEQCPIGCPNSTLVCPGGNYCSLDNDTLEAICVPGCDAAHICGNQCCPMGSRCTDGQCKLANISIDAHRVQTSVLVETVNFNQSDCEIVEHCVGGPGERMLMRFDLQTPNTGEGDLFMGDPTGSPLFEYSQCHMHYHFTTYASYKLLDGNGNVVATGHKQAFCLLDSEQVSNQGSPVPQYNCGFQGISAGWSDVYTRELPCQWVDITGVPPGDYMLDIQLNSQHILIEQDYSDDHVQVAVKVPFNSCPNGCNPVDAMCCSDTDVCGKAGDGVCDCGGLFAWDSADCDSCQNTSPLCTSHSSCPAGCSPNSGPCCSATDTCGLANNHVCDCEGAFDWDSADCGTCSSNAPNCPVNSCPNGCLLETQESPGCCTDANACNYANDGWCDCGGVFDWDAADCAHCVSETPGCPSPLAEKSLGFLTESNVLKPRSSSRHSRLFYWAIAFSLGVVLSCDATDSAPVTGGDCSNSEPSTGCAGGANHGGASGTDNHGANGGSGNGSGAGGQGASAGVGGGTCSDGEKNRDESDVDCGGSFCVPCLDGYSCKGDQDCAARYCDVVTKTCLTPSCTDGAKNGLESDLDCGFSCPKRCDVGQRCNEHNDCTSRRCIENVCEEASCSDGLTDGGETDRDCGGTCSGCDLGANCLQFEDCASLHCADGKCVEPTCDDGVQNGSESDSDCGSVCPSLCPLGNHCTAASDCVSNLCIDSVCIASCEDRFMNQDESDVDCGGSVCAPCSAGKTCHINTDCVSSECDLELSRCVATCTDGEQSEELGESDIDCGGMCSPCWVNHSCFSSVDCASEQCLMGECAASIHCYNTTLDSSETDIDCGGPQCPACSPFDSCLVDQDCNSFRCVMGKCSTPSCEDGVANGAETDVDCGGGCTACELNKRCLIAQDCVSLRCFDQRCVEASCLDGVKNGDEVSIDCGGSCAGCATGIACTKATDCASQVCLGTCQAPSCSDGVMNAQEGAIDCGGDCPKLCGDGLSCQVSADCESGVCAGPFGQKTCHSANCYDGVKNGEETDVDCGGSCEGCHAEQTCANDQDCLSGQCSLSEHICVASCTDGEINGSETFRDCGGGCPACRPGQDCLLDDDCTTAHCVPVMGHGMHCVAIPSCSNGVKDGEESDLDCGGPFCPPCIVGAHCDGLLDCWSGRCAIGGVCE